MKKTTEHNLKMNDVQGMYVLTNQEIDEISGGSLFTDLIRNPFEHFLATVIGTFIGTIFGPVIGVATGAALNSLVPHNTGV